MRLAPVVSMKHCKNQPRYEEVLLGSSMHRHRSHHHHVYNVQTRASISSIGRALELFSLDGELLQPTASKNVIKRRLTKVKASSS